MYDDIDETIIRTRTKEEITNIRRVSSSLEWSMSNFERNRGLIHVNSEPMSLEHNVGAFYGSVIICNEDGFSSSGSRFPTGSNYIQFTITFDLEPEKSTPSKSSVLRDFHIELKLLCPDKEAILTTSYVVNRQDDRKFQVVLYEILEQDLHTTYNDFVSNATLKLSFTVIQKLAITTKSEDVIVEGQLIQDIRKVYRTMDFADLEVEVDDKVFKMHKFMFMSRLKDLKEFAEHIEKTASLQLVHFSENIFEKILEYVYTDTIQDRKAISSDLAVQAAFFDIAGLKKLCLDHMKQSMDLEMAMTIVLNKSLIEKCPTSHEMICETIRFIAENKKVRHQPDYLSLGANPKIVELLLKILRSQ